MVSKYTKILGLCLFALPGLSYSSTPMNDSIVIDCGMMHYIPLHGSTPAEKIYRAYADIPDSRTITITIIVNCKGHATDVSYVDYKD